MKGNYSASDKSYALDDAQQVVQLRAMRRDDPSVVEVVLACSYE